MQSSSASASAPPSQPLQPLQPPQQPLRHEKIIAPAIYFTPASSSVNLHPHPSSTAAKSYEHMGLAELQSELEYLAKSVSMLLASNSEMQAIDPQHTDPDLTQAIGENVAIILKRNAAISRLRRCIIALQPHAAPLQTPREQQQRPQRASSATVSRAVTFAPSTQTDPNVQTAAPVQQNGLYL